VESVVAQVKLFSENTEQSDDLTLLAISYTPTEEQLILDEHLTLHNNVQEVAALSAFVKDVTARLNIAKPLASKLRLALEEAVVNVIDYAYPTVGRSAMPLCSAKNVSERSDHAYPAAGEINIHVTCSAPNDQTTKQLKFVITDSGIPFNPTEVSAADTTLSAEERPVGGLGILLVRKLMDSINYERINEKNVLTLTKKI
jgi:sigma-B regulation protein RsbU (phosphoserine phosphatase)